MAVAVTPEVIVGATSSRLVTAIVKAWDYVNVPSVEITVTA